MKKILQTISLLAAVSVTTAIGQMTAIWTGGGGDGLWNNAANWDIGIPAEGTNAFIGSASTVSYNVPMAASSFGILTNNGVLNINAGGFNSGPVLMLNPGGTGKLYINSGGTMNVTGNFGFMSNSIATLDAGGSLTVSGIVYVGSGTSGAGSGGTPNSLAKMTNNGGFLNASGVRLNSANASVGNGTADLFVINGGTNNLGDVYIGRASGSTQVALDSEGLVINGGVVQMTSLLIGNNSWGLMQVKSGVTVTNLGDGRLLMVGTSGRPSRMYQSGGLYVTVGTNYLTPTNGTSAVVAFSVTGGTNFSQGFYFGERPGEPTANGICNFTNGANIYVGGGGIGWNGVATVNALLNSGSILGASTDWTNTAPLTMNGGSFDCEDANGTAHNIYSSGLLRGSGAMTKTGSGTLTLTATNTYTGSTTISAGTLALATDLSGSSGSLASPLITVGSGTTFDVTGLAGVGGFSLNSGKTIAGIGTVTGTFTAKDGSIVAPAGSGAQGTLNFANGLSASNAVFNMELSSDPNGVSPVNDRVSITGDFNAYGTNIVVVTPVGSLAVGTYKLIAFTGNFNGNLANLTCAAGTLTNQTGEIDLIVTQVRPVENLVWRGDGSANIWDTGGSSNWFNGATLDRFYTGDTNTFDDTATNFIINISGVVTPTSTAVVTVNATNDYTFAGGGDIAGTTGLTKTNSGKLTILNVNDYTGITTIGGGTLSVTNLESGGLSSPIGAAGSAAANLVFNGGTLEYLGNSKTINRSATLQTGGGTLRVTNSVTLTLSGSLTGGGSLTKTGNGQLTLNSSSDYSGGTTIKAGTLRTAQGSGANISALGSGTLTLNGQTNGSAATFLFGGDQETLNNTLNLVGTNNFLQNNGNDTISSVTGNGTVMLEGSGSATLSLQTADISAFTGTFYIDTLPNFRFFPGGSSQNLSSATVNLGTGTALMNNRNGNVTIQIGGLFGGSDTRVQGASSANNPTTYIIGGNNADSTFSGSVTEVASTRIVNLVKTGTGTFTLNGGSTPVLGFDQDFNIITNYLYTNTVVYTGTTVISNGVLKIAAPTLLTNSPSITLASSTAVLDTSSMGYPDATGTNLIVTGTLEVVAGETLGGIGTIRGTLVADSGSTLNIGLPVGILTVTNSVTLNGTTVIALNGSTSPNSGRLVSSTAGVINYGGALIVTNVGATLHVGDTFTLFSATALNNSFSSITLPAGYTWTTNLAAGTITVQTAPAGSPPSLSSISVSGGDIALAATNGTPNGPVDVLTSTNLALPVANWDVLISTNFDNLGNFNYTATGAFNATAAQRFYLLRTP